MDSGLSLAQLTKWAEECLRINHLNTLVQREISAGPSTGRRICLSVRGFVRGVCSTKCFQRAEQAARIPRPNGTLDE